MQTSRNEQDKNAKESLNEQDKNAKESCNDLDMQFLKLVLNPSHVAGASTSNDGSNHNTSN